MLAEVDDELQALDADGALRVEKDLEGLTEKDKMKLLMNDAPELKSLMSDFTAHMKVLRGTLLPARVLALSRSAPQAGRIDPRRVGDRNRAVSRRAVYYFGRRTGSVSGHGAPWAR